MTSVPETELAVVVADRARIADKVVALRLRRPDGAALPRWEPGAHIDVLLDDHLERQYSLCGPSDVCDEWRIAVLLEAESRGGSARIHREVEAGSDLRVRGPRNHFRLVPVPSYVFIAGGIGITPILPMIDRAHRAGAEWTLLYGGRSRDSMAFVEELAAYGDRVTLWPQDEHGLLPLRDVLDSTSDEAAVYACGPTPLLDAVETAVAGRPPGTLHMERFVPKAKSVVQDRPFRVVLTSRDEPIQVGADESIVQALRRCGISVRTSCEEGVCGTCESDVIGGIPEHRDSILSPEEQAANDVMMICVSRAVTDELVIDR